MIAGWGNHGELADRGTDVAALLRGLGRTVEALKILPNGNPSHPHARGKNFIPYETQPVVFG